MNINALHVKHSTVDDLYTKHKYYEVRLVIVAASFKAEFHMKC